MKLIDLEMSRLVISEELSRSGSAKQFEERLRSSIEEIGLAEPIKVAPLPTGNYVVVDGTMRLKAIAMIQEKDPAAFPTVPAYVLDYDRRHEIRYQTDIYQDLLPSQLAELVEHLHQTEHIPKADIARYIGVAPTTLRNYTGLWRLLQRGGLFAKVVDLMDVEVIPSSNPYAWLRLTAEGLQYVLERDFSDGEEVGSWIERCVLDARRGKTLRFPIKLVEAVTDDLPAEYYRETKELRAVKRDLGLRRAAQAKSEASSTDDVDAAAKAVSAECYQQTEELRAVKRDLSLQRGVKPEAEAHDSSINVSPNVVPAEYYRETKEFRAVKRDLGLRRAAQAKSEASSTDDVDAAAKAVSAECYQQTEELRAVNHRPDVQSSAESKPRVPGNSGVIRHLSRVSRLSSDPVLRSAASSLRTYLQ